MSSARVVVTGAGVVSALGAGLSVFTGALRAGGPLPSHHSRSTLDSGGSPAAESSHATRTACVPPAFANALTLHQSRRLDRLAQLVVVAAREAFEHARLAEIASERIGVVAGTGLGCIERTSAQLAGIARSGLAHADAMGFPESMGIAPAAHVAIACACRGPSFTVMERETSAEGALALAALLLDGGAADAVLVAAGDAWNPVLERILRRIGARDQAGEGAGALVLESAQSARHRGVPVLGRILGYALEAEPPSRAGPGERSRAPQAGVRSEALLARARSRALAAAGLSARDVTSADPSVVRERTGAFMADGILQAIAAIAHLRADRPAVVLARRARGPAAAAFVFGAPERAP